MSLAATAAINWGWTWPQIMDCPLPVLVLLWRQTARSMDQNVGFDLSDLELIERLKSSQSDAGRRKPKLSP